MRTKTETIKKYTSFINEVLTLAIYETKLPREELLKKYGVNSHLFQYLVDYGIIKRTGGPRNYRYVTVREDLFSEKDAEKLIQDYTRWVYRKNHPHKPQDKILQSKSLQNPVDEKNEESAETGLSDIPTEDIIAELRKRGYSGILEQKKRIRI